ncbi:uncharacterized protein AMSG_10914 [Thecamonas trahens ATCC 50062]|uniref:Uncharacterized protein n=1 Tax=Thecamonas trahens ATCC 50062 TaxID=461836 RepID=A0A0L0DSN0_THETB|nr:hypothetical protein AMSG_10914 [Thecamonas trahens ATCC 50062]KNC55275.1 hypothetical protein AMSG_10914 [Thecamonas trahens ATCC 50062]|eukprot:XP_013753098.1 hypothetical protein AMSG_10914 [Thecamonas trahens ATCC 50062]
MRHPKNTSQLCLSLGFSCGYSRTSLVWTQCPWLFLSRQLLLALHTFLPTYGPQKGKANDAFSNALRLVKPEMIQIFLCVLSPEWNRDDVMVSGADRDEGYQGHAERPSRYPGQRVRPAVYQTAQGDCQVPGWWLAQGYRDRGQQDCYWWPTGAGYLAAIPASGLGRAECFSEQVRLPH